MYFIFINIIHSEIIYYDLMLLQMLVLLGLLLLLLKRAYMVKGGFDDADCIFTSIFAIQNGYVASIHTVFAYLSDRTYFYVYFD